MPENVRVDFSRGHLSLACLQSLACIELFEFLHILNSNPLKCSFRAFSLLLFVVTEFVIVSLSM